MEYYFDFGINPCIEVEPVNLSKFLLKWHTFAIFVGLLLIAGSCINISDQDPSLTLKEYRDQGMPEYSRLWNYEDYMNACNTLNSIRVSNPLSLPKKESKKSGKYFERIVNPNNMSFFMDTAIPLNERAYQIQPYVDILGYLTQLYTDLNHTEQYYNRELIELYIFGLFITENMLDLGNQINESIDEEDMNMQSGFFSIQDVYFKMVMFLLENQKKSSLFETEDLEKLSYYLYNSVLNNRSWIEVSAVEKIKLQIQEILDNTASDYIKKKYYMLIEIL